MAEVSKMMPENEIILNTSKKLHLRGNFFPYFILQKQKKIKTEA